MAIYVDVLRNWGWKLGASCHMITDGPNEELHAFAAKIGLKRTWFQASISGPHYDLTTKRRAAAVKLGAIELEDRQFHEILSWWRKSAIASLESALTEEERIKIRAHLFR